ncbi:MAG: YihY/virulence factor BrkB family protein [Actinomycetota bacterium]|nr:YihY/virulence factor BrkB family protein [Actinomycetota bacterium]
MSRQAKVGAPTDGRDDHERAGGAPPDPDDRRKPQAPSDLHKPSWKFAVKRTLAEFSDDQCTDLAAGLTYYAVLSVFPAAIAVVSLLGVVGQGSKTITAVLDVLRQVGAAGVADTIRPSLEQIAQSKGAGLGLAIGLVAALWSASGYVGAFGRAMNRIYEIDEGRPFWKLRPVQILVTMVAVALIALVAVSLVVTGPLARAIGDQIGLGRTAVTVFSIAKWPVIVGVVVVVIAILYYATPNVRQPKFRWMSVGALAALVVWVVASALFGLYVANFSSYDKTYGSLAGVIVFLLWLWLTNLALLFGAELDSELERSRQLQAGLPAEDSLQLPPRDDRTLVKKQAKDRKAHDQAVDLRERADDRPNR